MSTARVQEYLSSVPIVTRALLFINITIHIAVFVTSYPVINVAINPILVILRGEYYRVVTSAFIHGGLLHIAMNMSSLLAIGRSLEIQYGSLMMLMYTLWGLVLTGTLFVALVWAYSIVSFDPSAMNTTAVGYSGVLFAYALAEAFHASESEPTRSIFGLISVPTKYYPFILLVLIQVMMPNISWWGHLSGLLVGIILISRPGADLFLPSPGFLLCVEKSACWGCVTRLSGYVLVQDKHIVHSALDCAAVCRTNAINNHSCSSDGVVGALVSVYKACGSALSWVVSSAVYVLWLVWSVVAAGLQVIGVPVSVTQGMESCCVRVQTTVSQAVTELTSRVAYICCCHCFGYCNSSGDGEGRSSSMSDVWYRICTGGYTPLQQQEDNTTNNIYNTSSSAAAAATTFPSTVQYV